MENLRSGNLISGMVVFPKTPRTKIYVSFIQLFIIKYSAKNITTVYDLQYDIVTRYGLYKYQMEEKPLKNAEQSSLRSLAERTSVSLESLIRGNNSLGHFMEEAHAKVFPSPENQSPNNKGYLTGGYITRHHGSKKGGKIDAIQV